MSNKAAGYRRTRSQLARRKHATELRGKTRIRALKTTSAAVSVLGEFPMQGGVLAAVISARGLEQPRRASTSSGAEITHRSKYVITDCRRLRRRYCVKGLLDRRNTSDWQGVEYAFYPAQHRTAARRPARSDCVARTPASKRTELRLPLPLVTMKPGTDRWISHRIRHRQAVVELVQCTCAVGQECGSDGQTRGC